MALRERLSVAAERLRDLSLRRLLMLGFGTLVLLLLLLALLPGGGALMLFPAIVTQLLHAALLLALAPLLVGVVRWLKARLLGRRGAHPFQPWRDLRKLLRKQPVLAEGASPSPPPRPMWRWRRRWRRR
ncbi:hypothetical protein [Teichococcus aestuarii]|uniref:hypothetical protein n=1 Tax=Teichococcus aestuarii TaxID=568898 RepID=UPI0036152214